MGTSPLEALREELAAIDGAACTPPHLPTAVLLQEAHALSALLQDADIAAELLGEGVAAAAIERLPAVIAAAHEAELRWMAARSPRKDQAQRARERHGTELRSSLLAVCRWNLREDYGAQATLSAVASGDTSADLIQDLHDLARLIHRHGDAFHGDDTFNAASQAEAARRSADAISAGLAAAQSPIEQVAARRLRDRAFALLHQHVSQLREAGRHRYRHEPPLALRFTSSYGRAHRRKAQATASQAPGDGPTQPVTRCVEG